MRTRPIATACCLTWAFILLTGSAPAAPVSLGLVGWYDAGDVDGNGIPDGLPNGSLVTTWVNKANPGTNDGVAAATPTVANGAGDTINGQPVVRFTGSTTVTADKDYFALGTIRTDLGGYQAYLVSQSNVTVGASWQRMFTAWDGAAANDYIAPGWALLRPNLASGAPQAYPAQISQSSATADRRIMNVYLGRNGMANQEWFAGDMAEAILFDRALNSAEDIIVRNYLSSKYDISIGSADHYTGDTGPLGNYDLDVFGIGRVNASSEQVAGSSAGLAIAESGDTLGDNEWVLAGHRVGVNSWIGNDSPLALRSDRVWYLDKTGGVDVTLTFDLGDAGLTDPKMTGYMLLYSQTNAFSFTNLGLAPIISGDQISFNVPNSLLLDGYYTLATVPEPSTLLLLATAGLMGLAPCARRRRKR